MSSNIVPQIVSWLPHAEERAESRRWDAWLFGFALCAVPASIAVAETLLTAAVIFRIVAIARHRVAPDIPRMFWIWLGWAALEIVSWLRTPDLRAGQGEIRHLLLIAALFLLIPALESARDRVVTWRGIILVATISSLVLIAQFVAHLMSHRGGLDPVVYLRGGGLLHHWMIYGTVETMVFAGLLEFWRFYPEERRWLWPVTAIHVMAIVLSLTRMLWICCLLLLVVHLIRNRSRWIVAVPVIPCILFLVAPNAVRSRVTESASPDYYSNAERIQMLQVGWRMVRERPLTGVGPGRVKELYTSYLAPGDPVPAYHGHLHNNVVQIAAESGVPAIVAAMVFVVCLFRGLRARWKAAASREQKFLCATGLLSLIGFLAAGMCDYTYGHSLGLILAAFAMLPPSIASHSNN